MKKTTIYILSVIVLAITAASVLIPTYNAISLGVEGFSMGLADGLEETPGHKGDDIPLVVKFKPETMQMLQPTDSINFNNAQRYPIVIDRVTVMVPEGSVSSWTLTFNVVSLVLSLVCLGILLWKFIRFIANISKERIFVSENVKLLRISSYMLFAISAIEILSGVFTDHIIASLAFELKGYDITSSWIFPWSNLMLGAISLLMAQIWARGLEIQQDQELTI